MSTGNTSLSVKPRIGKKNGARNAPKKPKVPKQGGRFMLLTAIPNELKNNSFVLAAVENQGIALEYAGPNWRADKDIVLAAVKQEGQALQFASDALRDNEDVVRAALNQNVFAFVHASERLRDRDDIFQIVLDGGGTNRWRVGYLIDSASDRMR